MKNVLLLVFLLLGFGLQAQNKNSAKLTKLTQLSPKLKNTFSKFSISATAGTPSFSTKELSTLNLKKMSSLSLADLNISYKMNSRVSFGINMLGSLGNCSSGYYNQEGTFVAFMHDDYGDDGDDDDDDDLDELDDDDDDDDHDDECDDDEIGNLLGSVTFKLSEKFPLFVQAAGGYSFGSKAPAYSAMLGYNQKIFAGLGIIGGIRFSDVFYKKPVEAKTLAPSSGLKAELGLSWNF